MLYSFMNRPFAVSPVSGVIPVDEMLQVSVEFQPVTVGEHVGEMIVHYDSGRSALYVQSLCYEFSWHMQFLFCFQNLSNLLKCDNGWNF